MMEEAGAGYTLEWPQPNCACVRFEGDLDAFAAVRLRDEVIAFELPGHPRVVVDLSDVAFIDSTGIRLLLELLNRFSGGDLVIVGPQATGPRRALEIVGLGRVVPLVDALADALALRRTTELPQESTR